MKVVVQKEKCQGHAVCMLGAPEVYELSDEGFNQMDPFEVKPGLEEQARKGARACPEIAIEIIE